MVGAEVTLVFGFYLFVAIIARRDPFTSMKDATVVVHERGEQWLQRATLELAGLDDQSVNRSGPLSLQVRTVRRPTWAYFVAVHFFPIRLIALMATTQDEGAVAVVDDGEPSTVRLRGRFTIAAVDAINRAIP